MTVETARRASWLDEATDDDFCHIADGGTILCGAATMTAEGPTCEYVRPSLALCGTCGLPRCPRCATLDDLATRAEV